MPTFEFAWDPAYRLPAAAFGVRPATTAVTVDDGRVGVRFGPWRVESPVSNVAGTTITGPYTRLRTIGPPHLSLSDRGMTCATNPVRGLCVRFERPVTGIEPWGLLRHPGVTVTVADPEGLARALEDARTSAGSA